MTQPPHSSPTGPGDPWTPPSAPAPGWPQPSPQPSAQGWEVRTPTWQPVPPPLLPPAPPATAKPGRSTLLLVGLAALVGTLAGAVGSAFLVANVVVDGTEIGANIADEMESAVRDAVSEGMTDGLEQSMEDLAGAYGGMYGMPPEDVEQFPPAPPQLPGPDPVLDGYAQDCFGGDLQACDDLLYESPPLSDYEEYASTCGGRVKAYAVFACTELE